MSNEVNIGDMIYLTIPKEWIKTYHSLLYMLASVGKQIIDDCSYTCQGSGRNIFTCWNLFQSALAAKALGDNKRAQFFIDYIDKELVLYARHSKIIIPNFSKYYPSCIYKINNDGSYTFIITCKVNGIIYTKEIIIPETDSYCIFSGGGTTYEKNNVSASGTNFNIIISKSEDVTIDNIVSDNEDISATINNDTISVSVLENESTTQGRTMHVTIVTSINTLTITVNQKKADVIIDTKMYYGKSADLPSSVGTDYVNLVQGTNSLKVEGLAKTLWIAIPSVLNVTVTGKDYLGLPVTIQSSDSQISGYVIYYRQASVKLDECNFTIVYQNG